MKAGPGKALPEQETWAFDPPRDEFSPEARFDLRSLNEKVAGQSGFRVRQQNSAGSGQPLPRGAQVRLDVPAAAIRVLGE